VSSGINRVLRPPNTKPHLLQNPQFSSRQSDQPYSLLYEPEECGEIHRAAVGQAGNRNRGGIHIGSQAELQARAKFA